MFTKRVIFTWYPKAIRQFTNTARMYENKPSVDAKKPSGSSTHTDSQSEHGMRHTCRPTDFQKWILVWVKRYPSVAEVPNEVSSEVMQQAQTRGRIRLCNYMIVISVIGFIIAVWSGKRDLARGETMEKKGMDFYKEIRTKRDNETEASLTQAQK